VGLFPIWASGAEDANYNINYVQGTLQITLQPNLTPAIILSPFPKFMSVNGVK
jgi:hypothetical protein